MSASWVGLTGRPADRFDSQTGQLVTLGGSKEVCTNHIISKVCRSISSSSRAVISSINVHEV